MLDAAAASEADQVPDPATLVAAACDAAQAAASLIRTRARIKAVTSTKSTPTDIVTATDLESEQLIRSRLGAETPGAGFLAEEGGSSGGDRRLQWIVDPLDGTVNFWYGLPVLAVSIAAASHGVIVAGAVVDVATGEVFSATRGGGSFADGAPIAPSGCTSLAQALVTTGFSYRADLRRSQGAIAADVLPRVRDIRCFGSAALQLCWVASGRTDAHYERDIKLWDHAAGALVAAEAGALVEGPCPENSDLVIAASPALFEPLRRLVEH